MSQLSKNEKMPTCPVKQIRKLYNKTLMLEDEAQVSLELMLTICFPTVWNNVQKAMQDMFNQGYQLGKSEGARHEN